MNTFKSDILMCATDRLMFLILTIKQPYNFIVTLQAYNVKI